MLFLSIRYFPQYTTHYSTSCPPLIDGLVGAPQQKPETVVAVPLLLLFYINYKRVFITGPQGSSHSWLDSQHGFCQMEDCVPRTDWADREREEKKYMLKHRKIKRMEHN